jgi:uncharacterized protein
MSFTTSEKLQIAMLCDLARPEGQRELDFKFISRVVSNDDIWALSRKYPGLGLKVETPSDVGLVSDILEMWDNIESSYAVLNEEDNKLVKSDSYYNHEPKFLGFSGNYETTLMSIARILTRDLELWQRFSGRELDSHFPSIDGYRRLLGVWRPIRDAKFKTLGPYELNAGELIAVLREHVHTENRKPTTGGNWVLDESKK